MKTNNISRKLISETIFEIFNSCHRRNSNQLQRTLTMCGHKVLELVAGPDQVLLLAVSLGEPEGRVRVTRVQSGTWTGSRGQRARDFILSDIVNAFQ